MSKIYSFSIYLDKEIFDMLEARRGMIPRATFAREILERGLKEK